MGPKKKAKTKAASTPTRVTRRGAAAAAAAEAAKKTNDDAEEEQVEDKMEVEEEADAKMEIEEAVLEIKKEDEEKEKEEEDVKHDSEEEKDQPEKETEEEEQPQEGAKIEEKEQPQGEEKIEQEEEQSQRGEETAAAAKTFVIGSPEAAAVAAAGATAHVEDYSPIIKAALDVKPPADEITNEEKAAAVAEAAEAAVAEAVEAAVGDLTQNPVPEPTKPRRRPRNKWSKEEDQELMKLITAQGLTEASPLSAVAQVDFNSISQQLNLGRTAKQCRDRWKNYLRGGIKKGGWSKDEEELIKDMYTTFGPKWTAMAKLLTNRTDNDIKNKWYSMKRKEERQGLHEPSMYPKNLANRATTTDDQEVVDVPEDIAQRAAALSQIGVVGNPEPTAPAPALAANAAAAAASAAEVAAPAATESEEFSPRNWSADADPNKAEV